ncbi:MAG TPA: TetR/AcrR family transcriptional regulator [Polyangiaceae bacterium]|nr:TetR/AcrR family transcriptional regulator [Polyangiaceae bacterium]
MSPKKSLAQARAVAKASAPSGKAAAGKAAAGKAAAGKAVSPKAPAGRAGTPKSAPAHEAPADKPRVRDRILETAGELFYSRGIHCVGVDSIASEAGTNKMSLYRNFPSKEELVAEYLREQEREYWAVWDATIEPFEGNPRRQLEALFDGFLTRAKSKEADVDDCKVRRGCALGNAAVEIPEDDENLRAIVLGYKSELRRRLRKLSKDAGASEPDALGDALMLLAEGGCYTLSTFPGTSGPIASMAKAARALISIHLP